MELEAKTGVIEDNLMNNTARENENDISNEPLRNAKELSLKIVTIELVEKQQDDEVIKIGGDGSDSGVDLGVTSSLINGVLQRAMSNNSGGYASSSGGQEDNIGQISCNSSMISYYSDSCDKTSSTIVMAHSNDCCASEGGSESSSITGGPTLRKPNCPGKKKVAMKEPQNKSPRRSNESTSSTRSRSRPPSVSRSNTLPSKSIAPNLAARDRARSRDKTKPEPPKNLMTTSLTRSMSTKRPPKPDSLPSTVNLNSPSPRITLSRTPSLNRGTSARTPISTPTHDDGRWPSVAHRPVVRSARGTSAVPEGLIIRTRIGNIQLDNKSSVFDKYATLPRRRKEKSVEDLKPDSRSSSTTRDSPSNRMTVSLIKKLPSKETSSTSTPVKTLPAYPKIAKKPVVAKTKIYHEMSVQTAITSKDVTDAFAGNPKNLPRIDAVEMTTKETQSDIRDKEMEQLRNQLDKVTTDHSQVLTKLSEKSQTVSSLEQELLKEREEKLMAQKELQNNTERVMNMLGSFQAGASSGKEGDSLLMLESQLMISGNVLEKQQEEIVKLQGICRALQRDMERSLKVQDNLIRQKNELEEESAELQDFLQAEKVAFMEALKEAENENQHQKARIMQRESDLERQKEECRHLVRICEQRRQEFLGMQAKYNALESRSKEILMSQGSAVSGATVALTGLNGRIEHLVEQLITSYNISERDLEDVVFFNDAYSNSCSSYDGSPDYEMAKSGNSENNKSPQRGQSFLAAVINAIRNATSTSTKLTQDKNNLQQVNESDSTEMLDSETEPCLMMDNVLEDVNMPDSHSHNLVSTSQVLLSQIEIPSEVLKTSMCDDEDNGSLDNLSQAIANRQKIELQTGAMATRSALRQQSERNSTSDDQESIGDAPSMGDFCTAQSLVDQVIDVDNQLTKLLKVLRLVQMDNDNCIQELVVDKNKLQVCKEDALEKVNEWEMINQKLKAELKDAAQQLISKSNELHSSRNELQRHRQEIDRLNEDICNLSTLCSEKTSNGKKIEKDEILRALKVWQDSGSLPDNEIVSHVMAACNEIPLLKDRLHEKELQLAEMSSNAMNSSLQQAVAEVKRQYDAIDSALEILNGIQEIVKDCPELTKVQRDLEELNFNSINSLPVISSILPNDSLMTADLNANDTMSNDNGQIIDSTA